MGEDVRQDPRAHKQDDIQTEEDKVIQEMGVEEERGMENKVGGHAHFEVEECGEELESL